MSKITEMEIKVINDRIDAENKANNPTNGKVVQRVISVPRTPMEQFKNEMHVKYPNANDAREYRNILATVKQAQDFIEEYHAERNPFKKSSLESSRIMAEEAIENAEQELKKIHNQIKKEKEKEEQRLLKAREDYKKLFAVLDIESKISQLLLSVEKLSDFEKNNKLNMLHFEFESAIRQLKVAKVTY